MGAKKPYVPAPWLSGHCSPSNPPILHAGCRVVAVPRPGEYPDVMVRCICPTCEHDRCPETVRVPGVTLTAGPREIRCRLQVGHAPTVKHRERPPGVAGVVW